MLLILVPTLIEAASLLDEPADLRFAEPILSVVNGQPVLVALCGFGLAAAGAGASCSIARASESVDHVILVGTAGTYDVEKFPVTSTVLGNFVWCVDLGVPNDAGSRLTVEVPGISPWPESLPLDTAPGLEYLPQGLLLSVAGPAVNEEHARARRRDFPAAVGEEMEGYSVAIACQTYGIPLTILRGISNLAGDRDKASWRMREAMLSVKQALQSAVMPKS